MNFHSRVKFTFAIIIIILIVFELFLLIKNNKSRINIDRMDLMSLDSETQKNNWNGIITKLGGASAYEKFKQVYGQLTPERQHTLAHVFGGQLYKVDGLSAISVCDASFSYGCYHEYLGLAIHENGLQVVNKLNQACVDNLKSQSLACQHGIGHGILANLGYDYENLVQALNVCKDLPHNDPIGGCYGGVFMEYNFETLLSDHAELRPLDAKNPFSPCDTLEEAYKPACVHWQSQWWAAVLPGHNEERFAKIGNLCGLLKDKPEQDQCYMGGGTVVVLSAVWDPKLAVKLCENINSIHGQELCKINAASSFYAEVGKRSLAESICVGIVDAKNLEKCRQEAVGVNILNEK